MAKRTHQPGIVDVTLWYERATEELIVADAELVLARAKSSKDRENVSPVEDTTRNQVSKAQGAVYDISDLIDTCIHVARQRDDFV